jgi:hypothetical protein
VALGISADPANNGPERHIATAPDVIGMLLGDGGSLPLTGLSSEFPALQEKNREIPSLAGGRIKSVLLLPARLHRRQRYIDFSGRLCTGYQCWRRGNGSQRMDRCLGY